MTFDDISSKSGCQNNTVISMSSPFQANLGRCFQKESSGRILVCCSRSRQLATFLAETKSWLSSLPATVQHSGASCEVTSEISFANIAIRLESKPPERIIPLISIEEISIGVLPLLIPYVLMVLILVFFSDWVTYLPDLVYGPSR